MNITRETIDPAMRTAAQDVCADYSDIFPADARNLMGFFVNLRRLLMEVLYANYFGYIPKPCANENTVRR